MLNIFGINGAWFQSNEITKKVWDQLFNWAEISLAKSAFCHLTATTKPSEHD